MKNKTILFLVLTGMITITIASLINNKINGIGKIFPRTHRGTA